jgi:hypothetical protein
MRKETAARCPPTSMVVRASTSRRRWRPKCAAQCIAGRGRREAGVERTFIVA